MSDIHTILQLLQRQPTPGPPAYSTVTSSPDYHRPAVKVQPVSLITSHLFSHTGTQVSLEKAAAFFFFAHAQGIGIFLPVKVRNQHAKVSGNDSVHPKSHGLNSLLCVAGYFSVMM